MVRIIMNGEKLSLILSSFSYRWNGTMVNDRANSGINILLLANSTTTWSVPLNSHIPDMVNGRREMTRYRGRKIRLFMILTIWRVRRAIYKAIPHQRAIIKKIPLIWLLATEVDAYHHRRAANNSMYNKIDNLTPL